jgi:non-ribosomal peptide synthetase component F
MPTEQVEELTDTFRAVEYGDQSLTEREVERASAALAAILDDEEGSK